MGRVTCLKIPRQFAKNADGNELADGGRRHAAHATKLTEAVESAGACRGGALSTFCRKGESFCCSTLKKLDVLAKGRVLHPSHGKNTRPSLSRAPFAGLTLRAVRKEGSVGDRQLQSVKSWVVRDAALGWPAHVNLRSAVSRWQ